MAGQPNSDDFTKLVAQLDAPSKALRRQAAGRLAELAREPDRVASVRVLLDDPGPGLRWGAAFALAGAGLVDLRVAEVAIETLGDRDADLRWAALKLLREAGPALPELGGLLTEAARGQSAEAAKMAIYCLRDLGGGDKRLYRTALAHGDSGVRLAALSALAAALELAPDDVRAMEDVATGDAEEGVRRAARSLLDKRGERG